jgi:hypothetical protein
MERNMLTLQQAQAAITQRNSSNSVSPQQVEQLLANVRGTTLASIVTVTDVTSIAAAHKARKVQKVTAASVQLFNNVNDYDVYKKAVQRSAAKIEDNDSTNVQNLVVKEATFSHTNTFSLVFNKKDNTKFYLYAIYNNAQSLLFIDNTLATKQQVAELLQPAAAKKLLEENTVQHNVTNDVLHNVILRTISLDSIVQLKAMKQTVTV